MSLNVSEGSGTGDSVEDLSLQVSRGKRSKVWEFFEQDLVVTGGVLKAVCKYCSVKLTCHKKSGTSSLRAHIAESCPSIGEDDRKRFLSTLKTQPLEGCFTFDQQRSRELLTKFCIHAEVPFRKFEDPYFEEYVHSLQPTYKVIGRQTIRNDAFNLFEKMKLDTRFDFQNIGSRICLTSDIWTSNQNLGYMGVTAYYIDSSFNLKKETIAMKNVKYPHTAIALEEAIDRCLIEWNIKDKIFTLTLDNASNNTSACSLLQSNYKHDLLFEGEHLHVRCCAHILNILVQDGIGPINGAISKIRHLILHIASSPSRLQVFNGIVSEKNLPTKHGLATDVEHRWNSTFDMVDDVVKYKVVFNAYASEKGEAVPTDVEWKNTEAISAFLRAFEDATKVVSAHNKPTAHMFLHIVLCINHALEEAEWHSDNATLKELGKKMRDKFDKYWEKDYNVVLLIATVLDPSRRLFYLEWFYEKTCVTLSEVNKLVDIVKKWMNKYYEEYDKLVRKDDSQQRPSTTESSRILGSPVLGKGKLEEEFHEYRSIRRKGSWRGPKSKLELYYEEEPDDSIDDVLLWWKQNAEKYPILSLMVRDFLVVPLSTVPSVSAFSSGGRILGDTRSSLTPEMLEVLVCAKDWLAKPRKGDASLWR